MSLPWCLTGTVFALDSAQSLGYLNDIQMTVNLLFKQSVSALPSVINDTTL